MRHRVALLASLALAALASVAGPAVADVESYAVVIGNDAGSLG